MCAILHLEVAFYLRKLSKDRSVTMDHYRESRRSKSSPRALARRSSQLGNNVSEVYDLVFRPKDERVMEVTLPRSDALWGVLRITK